jgi:Tfp pilus assembly protein PilV
MAPTRGYALLETLFASMILATGLVSVASIFSVTVKVNVRNQQRTAATLLLSDKMEQLRSAPSAVGGGLDPSQPVSGFVEYVQVAGDGATFIRLWQVQDEPRTATVVVLGKIGAAPPLELARATTFW